MDHGDLLLCAASLRALFFDDNPMLISFAETHALNIEIECLETNLSLFLLSWLVPDEAHVSDFLMQALLDPSMRETFALDKLHQTLFLHMEGKGFEAATLRPDIWAPTRAGVDEHNLMVGVREGAPYQYFDATRRRVPLKEWGNTQLGTLKDIGITRRNILTYVANKLGGVHHDSKRLPPLLDDATQFKVLATAYDWDNDAIMHAGLVAVAIACIEIASNPDIVPLFVALRDFHAKRHRRLLKGEKLEK
jgi:hypothetical protein